MTAWLDHVSTYNQLTFNLGFLQNNSLGLTTFLGNAADQASIHAVLGMGL